MISDERLTRLFGSRKTAALYGDLIRWSLVLLLVAVWLAVLGYYVRIGMFIFDAVAMNDFGKFYYSTRFMLDGTDMYAPNPATLIPMSATESQQLWNLNPPHFHFLVIPFALLPLGPATVVWFAVNAAALIGCVVLATRELNIALSPSRWLLLALALTMNATTEMIVVTGQFTYLLCVVFLLSWRAARHERWRTAGAWMGVAVSVKPFLGLFLLYWLIRRRWTGLAASAAAGLACLAAGLVIAGWSQYVRWIEILQSVTWPWLLLNASIASVASRISMPNTFFEAPLQGATASLVAIGVALVAGGTVWKFRSPAHRPATIDHEYWLVLASALLISPLGWGYYIPLLIAPMVAVWRTRPEPTVIHDRVLVGIAVSGLLVPITVTNTWSHPLWAVTVGSAYFWSLLAVWLLALRSR